MPKIISISGDVHVVNPRDEFTEVTIRGYGWEGQLTLHGEILMVSKSKPTSARF